MTHVSMILAALAYLSELSAHTDNWRKIAPWLVVLAAMGYTYVYSRNGVMRYALVIVVGALSIPLSFDHTGSPDSAECILAAHCDVKQ